MTRPTASPAAKIQPSPVSSTDFSAHSDRSQERLVANESSDIYLSLIFTFWRRRNFCKLVLQLCARDFSFDEGEAVARFINVFLRPLCRRSKKLPTFS